MKYKVNVAETILYQVEVEADNEAMAREVAHRLQNCEEVEGSRYAETLEVEEVK
jgi:hypothetical protein